MERHEQSVLDRASVNAPGAGRSVNSHGFQFPNNEIRIHRILPISRGVPLCRSSGRCPRSCPVQARVVLSLAAKGLDQSAPLASLNS
ncbi:hypothetical protein NL676_025869, partial [Syzygium grande]